MSPTLFESLRLRLSWAAVSVVLALLSVPVAAKTFVVGTAMDPEGKAIRGARVSVLSEDGETVIASTESDKKGRVKIELDVGGTHIRLRATPSILSSAT